MEDAAGTDLRATAVLGLLLAVLNSTPVTDPAQAARVAALQAWLDSGGHRIESSPGSHSYAHAEAIRTFDAWWPLLVSGEFSPALGGPLYTALVDAMQINESPSGGQQDPAGGGTSLTESQTHKGSSFQYGWWGYVSKDLRGMLGRPVAAPLAGSYCGGGSLPACRSMLLATLGQAAATPASQVYPGDALCAAGDQWCADAIAQSRLGGISQDLVSWQNRPTYQQVAQFPAHRGDALTNLAYARPASASSTQLFSSNTPGRAVDGDDGTRWASNWTDNQQLTVDLGTATPVGRVILHWESAYGRAYRIDVSTTGSSWTTVYATSAGDGGTDVVTFPATTARYVRMQGVARGTGYGYSLWELEVYGR
jgi:hypothetical protein